MKYFDSHCHLDMEPLRQKQPEAIERAYKAGVTGIINVGSSIRGSRASVELAQDYPNIWASVGLHPHDAGTIVDLEMTMEELRTIAIADKVVAIGEIGLDFFDQQSGGRDPVSEKIKEAQIELFERQLALAKELSKPVILHIRDAWPETIRIIDNWLKKTKKTSNFGVVHCFTGSPENVKEFIQRGFCIGFTGFITFEQSKFEHIRKAIEIVPMERILIETDAPFLAPEPHRGKPNEPAYVVEVAKKVAEIKKISPEEVAYITTNNTKKTFNLF